MKFLNKVKYYKKKKRVYKRNFRMDVYKYMFQSSKNYYKVSRDCKLYNNFFLFWNGYNIVNIENNLKDYFLCFSLWDTKNDIKCDLVNFDNNFLKKIINFKLMRQYFTEFRGCNFNVLKSCDLHLNKKYVYDADWIKSENFKKNKFIKIFNRTIFFFKNQNFFNGKENFDFLIENCFILFYRKLIKLINFISYSKIFNKIKNLTITYSVLKHIYFNILFNDVKINMFYKKDPIEFTVINYKPYNIKIKKEFWEVWKKKKKICVMFDKVKFKRFQYKKKSFFYAGLFNYLKIKKNFFFYQTVIMNKINKFIYFIHNLVYYFKDFKQFVWMFANKLKQGVYLNKIFILFNLKLYSILLCKNYKIKNYSNFLFYNFLKDTKYDFKQIYKLILELNVI